MTFFLKRFISSSVVLMTLAVLGALPVKSLEFRPERTPSTLPAFTLKDHKGVAFSEKRLQNHWSLVLIGYTHCPDVCPTALAELSDVLDNFSARFPNKPLPQIVFFAVDPARDAPLLADYVPNFHKAVVGVTGNKVELKKVIRAIKGFAKIDPVDKHGDYTVQHSASVAIVDPSGQLVGRVNPPFKAQAGADLIARLIQGS